MWGSVTVSVCGMGVLGVGVSARARHVGLHRGPAGCKFTPLWDDDEGETEKKSGT